VGADSQETDPESHGQLRADLTPELNLALIKAAEHWPIQFRSMQQYHFTLQQKHFLTMTDPWCQNIVAPR
jgi:hypothetical protein